MVSVLVQATDLDRAIAIVNNEAITFSEYEAKLRQEQLTGNADNIASSDRIDPEVLETMIEERLQLQVAQNRGIVVTEQELDSVITNMAVRNNMTVDGLYSQIEQKGVSVDEFRANIMAQRKISKIREAAVNSRITITEQEVDYHLQAHRELYQTKESFELSHLFVSTATLDEEGMQRELENIKSIRDALDQGMEFTKAVQDYSDSEDASQGGYLGWRENEQLPDLFLDALHDTPIGGVTDVVISENGYHLLKLHAKQGDQKIVTQNLTRHILIQPRRRQITEEEALLLMQDIRAELAQGETFASLARLHSDDDSSAASGGELGWISPGETAPEFERTLQRIPLNQVSEPVRTQFGLHILEVTERRKKDISQDLARQNAYAEIFRRKSNEMFRIWFSRVQDSAYIEYLETGL